MRIYSHEYVFFMNCIYPAIVVLSVIMFRTTFKLNVIMFKSNSYCRSLTLI